MSSEAATEGTEVFLGSSQVAACITNGVGCLAALAEPNKTKQYKLKHYNRLRNSGLKPSQSPPVYHHLQLSSAANHFTRIIRAGIEPTVLGLEM
jgi:hypothetical protein